MKQNRFLNWAMAVAMLFAVNMDISAQTAEEDEIQEAEYEDYWLGDLTNESFKDFRAQKFQKERLQESRTKVQTVLKPDKIYGCYQMNMRGKTSSWYRNSGLMPQEYLDMENVNCVSFQPYKVFYSKGGKYYVVRVMYRRLSYDMPVKRNGKTVESEPDPNWNPGLMPAVEIPAETFKQYFK